mgnify:CR=1 FL=1
MWHDEQLGPLASRLDWTGCQTACQLPVIRLGALVSMGTVHGLVPEGAAG